MAYDPRYLEGIRLFNERKFHAAHDAWEDLWRERFGDERRFLQGLIQVAVALHHWENENAYGACKLYRQAVENFSSYPAAYCGLPLKELLDALGALFGEILQGDGERCPPFPWDHLPILCLAF